MVPLSDCRDILNVSFPTIVVGFYPISLTLSLVGIKLVSKVLLLTITMLAPVSRHISLLSMSAMKLCGV